MTSIATANSGERRRLACWRQRPRCRELRCVILTVFVLLASKLTIFGATFKEVILHPEKFDKKRVTIVAMARIGGDRFYLYQSPEPKLLGDDPRVIYGLFFPETPYYGAYDHKKVRVTGVVDISYRGLVGGNACSLIIERVRLAQAVEQPGPNCGRA